MTGTILSPERWQRIQSLLLDAIEQEGDRREAWLENACGGDPALLAEVRSLLAAHFSRGPVGDAPPAAPIERVGEWRLLRVLGEGGMGTVFLAERGGTEFNQVAALKLIRSGFVDHLLDERLRTERRILARLEHRGIARFIDGGSTPAGQPFVVMEYVGGRPIDAFCAEGRIPLRERVRLFLDVCDAVQYAHQQLVVHRDLKPGNIFVTDDGHVKLLDFGVAKALEEGGSTEVGHHTAAWITPAYASPEQVRGEPASTLSDVYALGIVLYELATGRRPFEFPSLSLADVHRVVCEQPPASPGVNPDLDLIISKTLAKEPERRYASVQQLRDDLRRWLAGEPVEARPDSTRYRLSRFVARHQAAVLAAAIALLAVVGGFAAVLWQARVVAAARDRAEQALARSEDISGFLIDLFETTSPADTAASRALIRRGTERMEALAGQPRVQAGVLDALGRIHGRLGQYRRSREHLARAVALLREHGSREELAASLAELSIAHRRLNEYADADTLAREALLIRRDVLPPDDPIIAQTLEDIGYLASARVELPRAESAYREALAIKQRTWGRDDIRLSTTIRALGAVVSRSGRTAEADSLYRLAVDVASRSGRDHPLVAVAEIHLGDRLARTDPVAAESLFRHAIAIQRRNQQDDVSRSHGLASLSGLLVARGQGAEALAIQQEAVDMYTRAIGPEHPETAWQMVSLADILIQIRRYDDADSVLRRSWAIQQVALGARHPVLAGTLSYMAQLEEARGRHERAEQLIRDGLELRRGLAAGHPLISLSFRELGQFQRRRGRQQAAISSFREALAVARVTLDERHPTVRGILATLDTLEGAGPR